MILKKKKTALEDVLITITGDSKEVTAMRKEISRTINHIDAKYRKAQALSRTIFWSD